MSRRYDERYEFDTTPSRAVVERYRAAVSQREGECSLALVHYRGSEEGYDIGVEYCHSVDSLDRITGAAVLGQLGWSDRTFLPESVEVLISLLHDADPLVIAQAASSLGHRGDPAAIPSLLPLVSHEHPKVRLEVAYGLSGHEDAAAITGLSRLASDEDREVRSWAVFGLGSRIECDTPEVREVLMKTLHDTDLEVRGEALVGLARRKDSRVVEALLAEWEGEDIGILSIEAAGEIGDSRLLSSLRSFVEDVEGDDDDFVASLLEAIESCSMER